MKKIGKNRGITLIALIITIIVLLILAGITIGALTSNNSVLKQSRNAKYNTKVGKEKEIIELSVMGAVSLNKDALLEESEFQEQLTKNADSGNPEIIEANEDGYIVKFEDEDGKRYYNVPNSSDIEPIDGVTSEKTLTVQCVNSKNEVLKEQTFTILTNRYSKNPPVVEGYQIAENGKLEGDITESKTIQVLYYLLLQDDTTLVFTGLNSSGNVTTVESDIVSYMIGTDTTSKLNGLKDTTNKSIKSILRVPEMFKNKPVTKISQWAFGDNTPTLGIISVDFTENITSIGKDAFNDCNSITELTLEKNMNDLSSQSFEGLVGLKKITFNNRKSNYGYTIFNGDVLWTIIEVKQGNTYYVEENNILYSYDKKTLIRCPIGRTGQLIIPNNVEYLVSSSFGGCTKISDIIINDTIQTIPNYCFRGCKNISSITIGENIQTIGNLAFYDCTNLKTVIINSSTIASQITSQTSLQNLVNYAETIYIKDDIITIGSYITENFSTTTSDRTGYVKYVKNT